MRIIVQPADAVCWNPTYTRQPPTCASPCDRRTILGMKHLHERGDYRHARELYMKVLARHRIGENMAQAFKSTGVRKSSFYERRFIVELMEIDPLLLKELSLGEKCATELNKMCKEMLLRSPQFERLKHLKDMGRLLP